MKSKINLLVLTIGLGVLLSLSTFGQRDTIKYIPFIVYTGIIDSNAYPVGIKDSFVITRRPELDTILKLFKVNSMLLSMTFPADSCSNKNYGLYQLMCNCNEYLLNDTLKKFNAFNNYDFICYAFLMPRASLYIPDFQEKNFLIYPNPITDYLAIENNSHGNYNLQLFKINGQAVYRENNISTNTIKLDAQNWEKGVYYILITNKTDRIVKKIIRN